MNDKVKYPVIIKYTDWELAYIRNLDEFYRAGVEEFDFYDGLKYIFDSEGKNLRYDQKTYILEVDPDSKFVPRAEVIQAYVEHLSVGIKKKFVPEFIEQVKEFDISEIIKKGNILLLEVI